MNLVGVPNTGAWAHLILSLLEGRGVPPAIAKRFPGGVPRPLVIVRSEEEDLEDVADGIEALSRLRGPGIPAPAGRPSAPARPGTAGLPPHQAAAFFGEDPAVRLASLEKLHQGAAVVFAAAGILSCRVPAPAEYAESRLTLSPGSTLPRKDLLSRLGALGFSRVDFVESPGEFAVRGGVVDFFPLEPAAAIRVLYEGDEIVSLRGFDPDTQAGLPGFLDEAVAAPARERAAAKSLAEVLPASGTWLVEAGVEIPVSVPGRLTVGLSGLGEGTSLGYESPGGGTGVESAIGRVKAWRSEGLKVLLFSNNRGVDERMQELIGDALEPGAVQFLIGPLRRGFVNRGLALAAVSAGEIFGRSYRRARILKDDPAGRVRVRWRELKKGDFVVHEEYGIARYLGLETVEAPGGARAEAEGRSSGAMDCLKLEFRGGDTLFVPMTEFKSVQKFVGSEGHHPRLSSLDTKTWGETKAKVASAVRDLAERLLKEHARRRALPGTAFPPETHMEREFAESFPYEETPDQIKTIAEVRSDMEAPSAMDRIVVGDTGFGKTEVAMRAALKCAAALKQAAVLVPTTILADQHHRTFKARFAEYPVRVEMLSRFQSKSEQKKILADLAAGKVDVVIGTHRLLSSDVKFKDLGLTVIDEEHRFGVKHKEAIRALKAQVDALTLSATPIPRTLHQGFSGLRSISLIQSAPTGRQPTATRVLPFDRAHVKAAIEAELARGGQVFYLHNRVRTLPHAVQMINDLVPGARVAAAHGQMRSDALEKTMWDFFNAKYDVLVASTIIESGLDIPSVNTLLVEDAQDFGLSQLYQLRGRIGRERRRAYCYLYYPSVSREFRSLGPDARKRLEALREFGRLGAGLSLAMRDLEIRGAGDLLGAKQHGFLNAVGVEFYSELLQSEIDKLKGKGGRGAPPRPAHLDLEIQAFIPEEYLPGDIERIRFYKRLLSAPGSELDSLRAELVDLSGPLPEQVESLFRVLNIRAAATEQGVRSVVRRGGRVDVYFQAGSPVPMEAITRWMSLYRDRIEFLRSPEGDGLRVHPRDRDPVVWITDFLDGLKSQKR